VEALCGGPFLAERNGFFVELRTGGKTKGGKIASPRRKTIRRKRRSSDTPGAKGGEPYVSNKECGKHVDGRVVWGGKKHQDVLKRRVQAGGFKRDCNPKEAPASAGKEKGPKELGERKRI